MLLTKIQLLHYQYYKTSVLKSVKDIQVNRFVLIDLNSSNKKFKFLEAAQLIADLTAVAVTAIPRLQEQAV